MVNFPFEWSNKNATISLGGIYIKVWSVSCHRELSNFVLRSFEPGCQYFKTLAGGWFKVQHVECYLVPLMSVKGAPYDMLAVSECAMLQSSSDSTSQDSKLSHSARPQVDGANRGSDSPCSLFSFSLCVVLPRSPTFRWTWACLDSAVQINPWASSTSHLCKHPANWNVNSSTSHPSSFYLPTFFQTLLCAIISFSTFFVWGGLYLLSSLNIILLGFQKNKLTNAHVQNAMLN